jgi:hypothetical protein
MQGSVEESRYHTRLTFRLDHLSLISGTIIGHLKGGQPKGRGR